MSIPGSGSWVMGDELKKLHADVNALQASMIMVTVVFCLPIPQNRSDLFSLVELKIGSLGMECELVIDRDSYARLRQILCVNLA